MQNRTIIITGAGNKSTEETIILDPKARPSELADLMNEDENFRNLILESINLYADRYVNPVEMIAALAARSRN